LILVIAYTKNSGEKNNVTPSTNEL